MTEKTPEEKRAEWELQMRLEKQLKEQEGEPARELTRLWEAFVIPFRGRGPYILLFAIILLNIFGIIPFLGLILQILVYSYVMRVIAHSARGADLLPPWTMEDLEEEFFAGVRFTSIVITVFFAPFPNKNKTIIIKPRDRISLNKLYC